MSEAVERYGRLVLVTRDAGRSADGHILSRWQCDCGATPLIAYSRIKTGKTVSCGCFAREQSSHRATKHGGKGTREYGSWIAMKRRCLAENDIDYPEYGGSGITIYEPWIESFEEFLAHIGPRPKGTTLDRIDGRMGYRPGNVRWATAQEQGRNRRNTFFWHIRGQNFETITEAAKAFSVSENTVSRWVNGQFDKRRDQFVKPRADCSVTPRYA